MKAFLATSLALFAVACGGGSGSGSGVRADGGSGPQIACSPRQRSNNTAVCEGSLGRGTAENADLAKSVPLTLTNTEYSGTVAYVTRSTTSSNYVSFIIPITNASDFVRCFVSVLSGQAASYTLFAYVTGSVGYSGTIYTDTCLSPSETGYLIDITNTVSYADVTSIALTLGAQEGMTISTVQVMPQSYAYDAATSTLSVLAQNTGALAANLYGGFHQCVLLDGAERALDFSFLDATSPSPLLPSRSDTLTTTLVFYGRASRLVVAVDFEGAGTAGALSVATTPEDQAQLDAVRTYKSRLRRAWVARN